MRVSQAGHDGRLIEVKYESEGWYIVMELKGAG
ncbi:MAG: hypothetical protein QOF14_4380 [Hyphomicrobiales bacterium]|jgi:hypothetical protein|nr:hypothetical protein [Hyphomicrobiales bacterium]